MPILRVTLSTGASDAGSALEHPNHPQRNTARQLVARGAAAAGRRIAPLNDNR